jgi:UDP:flavonoid glycosyltransferase YjiC (YdhE family)
MISQKLLPSYARVRAQLGLPPIQRIYDELDRSVLDLVVMSPTLFPRPDDWPQKAHVSGFLNAPPGEVSPLSPELEAFLAAGEPPLYVTFGSMSAVERDPTAVVQIIEEAVAQAGCRAIVQSEVPRPSLPHLFHTGPAPHAQIFPRCAAIVHHGGVGTTQAAMRAGRPSVIVAHIADQFLWGQQLERLGVAPPHLSRRRLSPAGLARAMRAASRDAAMRAQAERLGQAMQGEDGVQRAVELIGQRVPSSSGRG